jgi:hypothetical protein
LDEIGNVGGAWDNVVMGGITGSKCVKFTHSYDFLSGYAERYPPYMVLDPSAQRDRLNGAMSGWPSILP